MLVRILSSEMSLYITAQKLIIPFAWLMVRTFALHGMMTRNGMMT